MNIARAILLVRCSVLGVVSTSLYECALCCWILVRSMIREKVPCFVCQTQSSHMEGEVQQVVTHSIGQGKFRALVLWRRVF